MKLLYVALLRLVIPARQRLMLLSTVILRLGKFAFVVPSMIDFEGCHPTGYGDNHHMHYGASPP